VPPPPTPAASAAPEDPPLFELDGVAQTPPAPAPAPAVSRNYVSRHRKKFREALVDDEVRRFIAREHISQLEFDRCMRGHISSASLVGYKPYNSAERAGIRRIIYSKFRPGAPIPPLLTGEEILHLDEIVGKGAKLEGFVEWLTSMRVGAGEDFDLSKFAGAATTTSPVLTESSGGDDDVEEDEDGTKKKKKNRVTRAVAESRAARRQAAAIVTGPIPASIKSSMKKKASWLACISSPGTTGVGVLPDPTAHPESYRLRVGDIESMKRAVKDAEGTLVNMRSKLAMFESRRGGF
jgi:hypothetical protein